MTRIVLVDDSATQRAKTTMQLEAAGHEVVAVPDAKRALQVIDRQTDLLISDVIMPEMSGYDLCRAVKARPDVRAVPVMLLTSLDAPDEILHALDAGADAFVTKSRGGARIEERVRRVIETHKARSTARSDGDAVPVHFLGREIDVRAPKAQVLDLLMSVFEDATQANIELRETAEKLAAKNEALLRAEGLKRELSALLVHDLKSPAAGLMMLARGFLKKPALTSNEREQWTTVFLTAETCQRIVMNLLDINKSEDGALAVAPLEVELSRLVEDVSVMLAPLREDRKQTLLVDLERAPKMIFADPDLLRRVLLNLLDNALRHTPAGGTVRIEAGTEPGHLRISVRNEGDPIPAALRERIFQKYVRLSPELDAGMSGRGLGLTFCRIAIEAHRGTISVDDDPRGGTLFVLRLPQPSVA